MLAKFKMSLIETPAVIEKRNQRQAIAAARAERAMQREEARLRQERDRAKQAELAAQAAADAERAAAEQAARDARRTAPQVRPAIIGKGVLALEILFKTYGRVGSDFAANFRNLGEQTR